MLRQRCQPSRRRRAGGYATPGLRRPARFRLWPAGVGDDPGVGPHRHRRPGHPPADQRQMAEHAGAHISTVNAGHLSLVTRPDAVVKTIVAASDART
jgi:hypothetical protein